MTTNELRAKFEATFPHLDFSADKYGNYYSERTLDHLYGYQAAHASRDAEVEALKKRIEDAPVYYVPIKKPNSEEGWLQVIGSVKALNNMRGKHVRLVIDDAMQEDRK